MGDIFCKSWSQNSYYDVRCSGGSVKKLIVILMVMGSVLVSGCTSIGQSYQKPDIHLVSIKPLPSQSIEQRFLLGLRIINPNRAALPVRGLSYALEINGSKVLSGATGDIPQIPAYGDVLVEVTSGTSLLGSVKALSRILANPNMPFSYALSVRLDSHWWLFPVTITEAGEIELQ